jgi:hypothetical protein
VFAIERYRISSSSSVIVCFKKSIMAVDANTYDDDYSYD